MSTPNSEYLQQPKKYWWVLYMKNDKTVLEDVFTEHPFKLIDRLTEEEEGTRHYLINWKTIDVEEYNMWKTINNEE